MRIIAIKTMPFYNRHGLRNSQLIGLMPTSSTSQIFGNCECFEPYTSNVFTRRVYSGEYQVWINIMRIEQQQSERLNFDYLYNLVGY